MWTRKRRLAAKRPAPSQRKPRRGRALHGHATFAPARLYMRRGFQRERRFHEPAPATGSGGGASAAAPSALASSSVRSVANDLYA